ncbi:MAG TPA: protein-disulfide reductase DsbD domain-containing protein [Pseudacidobacterium sp.]|nr:protein-disulfide reductase DsbD domain-containing protein [Pseudacidobacterium sp.]
MRKILFAVLACAAFGAFAQKLAWQSDGQSKTNEHQFVQFLYPEQVTIAAGKPSTLELHFRVNNGLHINSHTPREKSFIPTQLLVDEPTGLKIASVDFPPGTDYSPAFSPSDKLSVYTGEFVLRAQVTAQPGDHLIQGALRYQACDSNSCYPPRKVPVAIDVIAK